MTADVERRIAPADVGPTSRATPEARPASGADDAEALIRANTENFPVGSFLIAKKYRPHVHAFYVFARHADDIADAGDIAAEEKVRQLSVAQAALGVDEAALPDWARSYHRDRKSTRLNSSHIQKSRMPSSA